MRNSIYVYLQILKHSVVQIRKNFVFQQMEEGGGINYLQGVDGSERLMYEKRL